MAVKINLVDFLLKLVENGVSVELLRETLKELGLDETYIETINKRLNAVPAKKRKVKEIAPHEYQVVIDAYLEKS